MTYFIGDTNIVDQDPAVKTSNDLVLVQSKNLLPSIIQTPLYSDLTDIIESEYDGDGILYNAFKAIDMLYPDLPAYADTMTDDEIDQHFQSLIKLIGHKANYKFIQVWSSSYTGVRNIRKELHQKILDLESIAFRRKYFGSYLGYKSSFNIIFRHGGVFPSMMYNKKIYDGDYEKLARLINYYHSIQNSGLIDKFLPWSTEFLSSYPKSGFIEGFRDAILFKNQYLNGSPTITNPADSTIDLDVRNIRRDYLVKAKDTKNIFLDISLDGVLYHPRAGVSNSVLNPCLMDVPWLEFIEKESSIAKRASENLMIGSQMTIVVDSSGFYNSVSGTTYTHTDTRVKAFIFRQNYLGETGSKNIIKIVLGIGDGQSKAAWFKSVDDATTIPFYGATTYDDQPYIDPSQLHSTSAVQDVVAISPNCEVPVFEANISYLEKFENVASDFTLLTPSVYSQTLKNAWDNSGNSANISTNFTSGVDSLISSMYTDGSSLSTRRKNAVQYLGKNEYNQDIAAYFYGKYDGTSYGIIQNLTDTEESTTSNTRLSRLQTTIDIKRGKIARGSLNLYFIVKPPIFEASLPFIKIADNSDIGYHFDLAPIDMSSVSSSGSVVTLHFDDIQTIVPVGSTIVVSHTSPNSYNGTYVVTSSTSTSVSFASTETQAVTKLGYFTCPVFIDRLNDFNSDFWIDGSYEKVNPLWQYINIYDYYDTSSSSWKQDIKLLKKIKVTTSTGSHYSYKEITNTDESYMYVTPGLKYFPKILSGGGDNDRYVELLKSGSTGIYAEVDGKSNTYTGIINFIAIHNQSFNSVVDSYLKSYNNYDSIKYFISESSYSFYGIRISQNSGLSSTVSDMYSNVDVSYYDIASAPTSPLFGVYNFITNTTQSMISLSDSSSAKVAITEMALFNDLNQIVMYANFPPVIYDSLKNHMSFNIFIKESAIMTK